MDKKTISPYTVRQSTIQVREKGKYIDMYKYTYQIDNNIDTGKPTYFKAKGSNNLSMGWSFRTCGSNCKLGYIFGVRYFADALRRIEAKDGVEAARELAAEFFTFPGLRQVIFGTCLPGDVPILKKFFDLGYIIEVPTGYGRNPGDGNYNVYHFIMYNPYMTTHVKNEGKTYKKYGITKRRTDWPNQVDIKAKREKFTPEKSKVIQLTAKEVKVPEQPKLSSIVGSFI